MAVTTTVHNLGGNEEQLARPSSGDFKLPAVECLPRGLDVGPIGECPVRKRSNRYQYRAAEVGERVLDLRWHGRIDGALNQAISFQLPEGQREHALRDALDGALE